MSNRRMSLKTLHTHSNPAPQMPPKIPLQTKVIPELVFPSNSPTTKSNSLDFRVSSKLRFAAKQRTKGTRTLNDQITLAEYKQHEVKETTQKPSMKYPFWFVDCAYGQTEVASRSVGEELTVPTVLFTKFDLRSQKTWEESMKELLIQRRTPL